MPWSRLFHSESSQVGLQDSLQGAAPLVLGASHQQLIPGPPKEPTAATSSRRDVTQGGHQALREHLRSGVLLETVSGPQKDRRHETCDRSICSQQVRRVSNFQDGHGRTCENGPPTRNVGDIHRPEGCLLSHPHSQKSLEIPPVSSVGESVLFHCPTVRLVNSSQAVHQDSQTGQKDGTEKGHLYPPIHRRLAEQSFVEAGMLSEHTSSHRVNRGVGLDNQLPQVRVTTDTGYKFPVISVPTDERNCPSHRQENTRPSRVHFSLPVVSTVDSSSTHEHHRSYRVHSETGPSGTSQTQAYPARIGQCVEMGSVFRQTRKHFPTSTYSSTVVDNDRESPSGSTSAPSSTQSSHLYRCVSTGMGCPLSTSFCQGSMGRCGVHTSHQCFGDEGGFKRPQSLQNLPSQLLCPGSHRQHDCGCIHKQGGGYQVMGSVCTHMANTDMVQNQSHCLNCETCPWLHQYTCGPTLSQGSTDPHRVVVTSASFPSDLSNRGHSTHRSICHQVQPQAPVVCVASSRPFVSAGGCNVDGLDRERLLRLSTVGFDSTVDEQVAQTPLQHAPNRSSMAHENVVPRTHAASMERALEVATDSRSLKATFEPHLSRKHSGAQSPCLVDQRGSSDIERELEIKQRISNPQRESTQRIYLSKFLIFSKWCDENAVSSLCPTTENISMFFLHLFKDKNLDPVTIQGYRSAIANQLYGKVRWDISHDPSLNRLIDSFFRDKPKICRNIPPWDLRVVLKALTQAPFEPLALAPLKWVTFKTCFLVTLASGKRCSEVHALLHSRVRFGENFSVVTLEPSNRFIAKNQLAKQGTAVLNPIVIKSLAVTLSPELRDDKLLCPVRALRYYLQRTLILETK